jgi:hypothetical protein
MPNIGVFQQNTPICTGCCTAKPVNIAGENGLVPDRRSYWISGCIKRQWQNFHWTAHTALDRRCGALGHQLSGGDPFAMDHIKPGADDYYDAGQGQRVGEILKHKIAQQCCHRQFQILHWRQYSRGRLLLRIGHHHVAQRGEKSDPQ